MSSGGDGKNRTVPKFGSFKPKSDPESAVKAPEPAASSSSSSRREGEKRTHHQHQDSRREQHRERHEGHRDRHEGHRDRQEGDRHRSKRHRDERRSSRSRSPRRKAAPAPASARDSATDSLKDAPFTIDRRGDPLILKYGSNDRSKVPVYRRYGAGKLMGSSGYLEIYRDGARDQFSIRYSREGRSAFRDKSLLLKVARIKARRFKFAPEEPQDSASARDDFIPLSSDRKRKRDDDGSESSSDEEKPIYRSIEGKAKVHEFSDSDLETDAESLSSSGDEEEFSEPKKRSIELSRLVKDSPEDSEAWLELIKLQDALFQETATNSGPKTKDELKGLAEIKISLTETALKHCKSPTHREVLLLGLMSEGAKVWTQNVLAKKWKETREGHAENFALWKAWLDFEMTSISTFTFDAVRQYLLDRISFLKRRISPSPGDSSLAVARELVYVFLRTTCFLQDAGFPELAVASWQAMLELSFARPTYPSPPDEASVMAAFGDFWESETARIGERGAKGWKNYAETGDIVDVPEPLDLKISDDARPRTLYTSWAASERQSAAQAALPARTLDVGAEDDPYRVVLFSDIQDLVIAVPEALLPSVQPDLIDAFLLFCGLPPISISSSTIKSATQDPFVRGQWKGIYDDVISPTSQQRVSEDGAKKPPAFIGCRAAISQYVLFAGNDWFDYLGKLRPKHFSLTHTLATNAVGQLVRQFGMAECAVYCLALETKADPSKTKRAAKSLLKLYPSSLELYNAYALAEWVNDSGHITRNVLFSAANQHLGSDAAEIQRLWNTWTWIELYQGRKQAAVDRLCSISDMPDDGPSEASQPRLLKARVTLASQRDYLLSSGSHGQAAVYAESVILLEYLVAGNGTEPASTAQGNISAAMRSVQAFSHDLVSRDAADSAIHERFLQVAAKLVYYHARHGPYRPAFVRDQLLSFIELFPGNTTFLALFEWADSTLRIDDPVRDVLQSTVFAPPSQPQQQQHDGLATRVFAVRHELAAGTPHSARAALESALEGGGGDACCRGSIDLWVAYLRLCAASPALRPRAREVFYRAVGSCPWSKEVQMEAFATLAGVLDAGELAAVYGTMASRGLRVHVELEPFEAVWKRQRQQKQGLGGQPTATAASRS